MTEKDRENPSEVDNQSALSLKNSSPTNELAVYRTSLANERTLLAYLRSGMALIIAGATISHFSQDGFYLVLGMVCILAGLATGGIGSARYRNMQKKIYRVMAGKENRPN